MSIQFHNEGGKILVQNLIDVIHENRAYLSDIDGKIGDGDHGINMDKGFQLTKGRLEDVQSMSEALNVLGRALLLEIGGSMGPLYGKFFKAMAKESKATEEISSEVFLAMLEAAYNAIQSLGNAKPGDKTMVDTLDPAVSAFKTALTDGMDFSDALDKMINAAKAGWQSTEDMVAKIGRSSRLGERSRGVLDAGATSCFLMLQSMAETFKSF